MKEDASNATAPIHKKWKIPLLRLKVNDICSEGSAAFFAVVNAEKLLKEAVIGVLESLYTYKSAPTRYNIFFFCFPVSFFLLLMCVLCSSSIIELYLHV